jgi:predicted ATPase
MIRRLYAHNYRCLQNTEVDFGGRSSVLLVGDNGAGKSALLGVIECIRAVALGTNRADALVGRRAVSQLDASGPGEAHPMIRVEVEASLPDGAVGRYSLAIELPPHFREFRVLDENLTVAETRVFTRSLASVAFYAAPDRVTEFSVDWHQIALPVIGAPSPDHPLETFRRELARIVLLRPVPSRMTGEGSETASTPHPDCRDFGAWFREMTVQQPAVYAPFLAYLRDTMPDLVAVQNTPTGRESRSLEYVFRTNGDRTFALPFEELSDGEKCLSVAAMVAGMAEAVGSGVFVWDEPDLHIALPEVQHLIVGLRRRLGLGQFIATSHHPETIRAFSKENALLVLRRSHAEPTRVRPVSEFVGPADDLAEALARGEIGRLIPQ